MSLRATLAAALCAGLCCSLLAAGSAGSAAAPAAAGAAAAAAAAPPREAAAGLPLQSPEPSAEPPPPLSSSGPQHQPAAPAAAEAEAPKDGESSGSGGPAGAPSAAGAPAGAPAGGPLAAGPNLRRLKGHRGGPRAARNSRLPKSALPVSPISTGWGAFLVGLGSLLSAVALWRKTSELYHSPRQALRKAKMRILGQVPASWEDYVRNLPVLDEIEFPELRPLLKRLEKKPVVLMSVPKPRARLAAFLGLTEEQREEGIVIKGKATAGCSAKEVAFELFAHEKLAKGLPLSLPALGAFRDVDASTLYLVTPRARADVSMYTRRMPEKVKLRLAFAEMVFALWGMHRKGWVHRDIKGCNYFVSQDGHALLADFEGFWRNGMHAIMYGEEVEIIFTEHYIAPELTFDGEYQVFDFKTDVYALGVTFREMLDWMGGLPVPHRDLAEDLIRHMTDADTDNRYDIEQCMKHPYFDGLNFELVEKKMYGKAFEGTYQTPYKFL